LFRSEVITPPASPQRCPRCQLNFPAYLTPTGPTAAPRLRSTNACSQRRYEPWLTRDVRLKIHVGLDMGKVAGQYGRMSAQYVIDEEGKKTGVLLSIVDYEQLMEA